MYIPISSPSQEHASAKATTRNQRRTREGSFTPDNLAGSDKGDSTGPTVIFVPPSGRMTLPGFFRRALAALLLTGSLVVATSATAPAEAAVPAASPTPICDA